MKKAEVAANRADHPPEETSVTGSLSAPASSRRRYVSPKVVQARLIRTILGGAGTSLDGIGTRSKNP